MEDKAKNIGKKLQLFWKEKGKKIVLEGILEIVFVYFAILAAYNWTGTHFGSYVVAPSVAFEHALYTIKFEQLIGLFIEEPIQQFFLPWTGFIKFWDFFYGFFHTVMVITVLSVLFFKNPALYQRSRTTIIVMNTMALFCFAIFPMMPPRLLNNCGKLGACDKSYNFVDSMAVIGGFWSWDNLEDFGTNQYAATPSMHIGYAIWVVSSFLPIIKPLWVKILLSIYPIVVLFCIVVTANHYWLDGLFGLIAWAIAYKLAFYMPQFGRGAYEDEKSYTSTTEEENITLIESPSFEPGDIEMQDITNRS